MKLDSNCQPRGSEPVFPYWRMLANSPVSLEGLSTGEPRAYGIGRQRIHDRSRDGTWVHVELRALSSRAVEVLTLRGLVRYRMSPAGDQLKSPVTVVNAPAVTETLSQGGAAAPIGSKHTS